MNERISLVKSPEQQKGVNRFAEATSWELQRKGIQIYELSGDSLKNIHHNIFFAVKTNEAFRLEDMPSSSTEVAIDPDQPFLPNSEDKTLREQEKLLEKFRQELGIEGAKAVIGDLPDYVELALLHFDRTGESLFKGKYGCYSIKTNTRRMSAVPTRAIVGDFLIPGHLRVIYWHRSYREVAIAPLIIPA